MKKRALVLLAACAVLFAAVPVFALPTCDDWNGDWNFVYSGDVKDNITINDVCNNEDKSNPACLPVKEGSPQTYWVCVARGKRLSDNKTIQIRRISFDPSSYFYYEGTDAELIVAGQSAPNAKIVYEDDCDQFTTVEAVAPIDLVSGKKSGSLPCDNGTDNCTLTTVPKKIIKVLSFANPFSGIIIIGDDKTAFTAQDKPEWDTTTIINLLAVKISKKIIIDIVFINPLSKDTGVKDFTVGSYCGTIEIK